MLTPSAAARDRRPVPGSRSFAGKGPSFVVCGTRAGVKRWGASADALIAPTDLDPGSLAWPVKGSSVCLMASGAQPDFVLRLMQALLADGAELVVKITDGVASIHTQPPTQEYTQ